MVEWSITTGCKPVASRLRRFESSPAHKSSDIILSMKFRALLFGVAILFTLVPVAAFATTTPVVQKPYCTLSSSRSAVELGKTVNLSWQSQHATQGYISSIGTVGVAGMQGVIPTGRGTTYTGTFTGPGGTGTCSITVSIIQPNGSGGGGIGDGGTVDEPETVDAPDKLAPSRGGTSPTTLPPANNITLSNTQSGGLIPCTGLNCEACHLASLAQRIINFLIGLSIPLAAAMFAYAGVIYFTSGVVDKIEKAHKIFKSVGIGFLIVLGAWLGIQTVLKTILSDAYYQSWNTIQCVGTGARLGTDPNKPITINTLLSVLPGLNTNVLVPGPSSFNNTGSTASCSGEGYFLTKDEAGSSTCYNPTTQDFKDPSYGPSFDERFAGFGDCSVGSLGNTWGNNAGAFSCIATGESSCNPALGSGTDKTSDNYAFSYGLYQVNMSAHDLQCSNYDSGQTVNCTSAFSGKNYNAKVIDSGLYNKCKNMLQNVQCNTEMAQKIFQKQGFSAWKNTATKCGLL